MRYTVCSLIAPALVLTSVLIYPENLAAQAAAVSGTGQQVAALAHRRAAAWKQSAPAIHCGPAPLTERPGAAAELDRPHLAPLEAAFLDAQRVKRRLAGQAVPIQPRRRP